MDVKLINHSCLLYSHGDVKMICDPWIEGRVFDNGWDFIVPSAIAYEDFAEITHIWFSHEHPDHFFPPNLNKISAEHRANITVVFQETIDKRVVNYCSKKGFKEVIELKPNKWYTMGEDFQVMCENYTEGDSWLAVDAGGEIILNTNDCEVNNPHDAAKIKEKVGGKVDALFAQFSYACWAGNPDQVHIREQMAKSKLDIFLFQINQFEPKYSIPIASYVWFCHQDNFYLNDRINKPDRVLESMQKHTTTIPVVLFPGESFNGSKHDNQSSVDKWMKAYKELENKSVDHLEAASSVEESNLLTTSKAFTKQLKDDFGLAARVLKPSFVYLKDLGVAYKLSLANGLEKVTKSKEECDIILGSDSLMNCMRFPWGCDTLGVNGRFSKPEKGNYSRFYNFFRYNQLKSRGETVNLGYLFKVIIRKIFRQKEEVSFYN